MLRMLLNFEQLLIYLPSLLFKFCIYYGKYSVNPLYLYLYYLVSLLSKELYAKQKVDNRSF